MAGEEKRCGAEEAGWLRVGAEPAGGGRAGTGRRHRQPQTPDRPCNESVEQKHTWGTNSQGSEGRGQGRAE